MYISGIVHLVEHEEVALIASVEAGKLPISVAVQIANGKDREISEALAEDLVQDAFMQLYQILRSGKDIEYPKAWTLCVLRRAVSRQMQDQSRFEQLDDVEVAQNWIEDGTDEFTVRNLLALLSPREEEVLLLRLEAMKVSRNRGSFGHQHEFRQHSLGPRAPQAPKGHRDAKAEKATERGT